MTDPDWGDRPWPAPYQLPSDHIWGANYYARCQAVADRHLRHASPEFCSWLESRLSLQEQAQMLAHVVGQMPSMEAFNALRRALLAYWGQWREYVQGGPKELRSEIANEP
jgi:hypothetical protein